MKIKFISLVVLSSLIHGFQMTAQTPRIQWWYNTHDFSAGQCAAKDFDGDGKYEVVFSCYRNDSNVYALNAEDGSLLWKYNTSPTNSHGCNDVAPIIYDIDNDGDQEVILPSSCNPKTYCFNGKDGSIKWECKTRGSDSPPTIADIDNDGKPEILHGEFNGYVLCINAEDGSVAWEILVDSRSWVQTAPTIVDLNNDGQLDFVVATWNFDYKDSIFGYDGKNHEKLWAVPVNNHIYHGSAVADLDADGKPELVIGSYNDTLYCLNGEDGSFNWKYKGSGYVGGPVSLGDIDLDGVCDVVFPSGSHVTALTNSGKLKWDYTIPNYGQSFRGVALSDINDDVKLDVIFGDSKGVLRALNGYDGSVIWNLNLASHYGNSKYELQHAPIVADFNGDDTLDIFIAGGYGIYSATDMSGNFGRAYMVTAGKGKGPNWLMFQRDERRQSSLFGYKNNSINDISITNKQTSKLFPNPASNHMQVNFGSLNNENHSIRIYNSEGKIVLDLEYIQQKSMDINVESWGSGIYFFQIRDNSGKTETGKFIIQK